jgi:glycosyltransferase involved in cell wall biosynthesis
VLTSSSEHGIEAHRVQAPEVSVVIIFLNAKFFLDGAIQSVLRQSFTDWELLLVDDDSWDGSSESAKPWAEHHADRILYLEHPGHANLGMSASRNLGIRHAKGRFVAFLDADDEWMPAKLTEHVAVMKGRSDVAMTYGPALHWRPDAQEDQTS